VSYTSQPLMSVCSHSALGVSVARILNRRQRSGFTLLGAGAQVAAADRVQGALAV
jgi:hypothetical protein